MEQPKRRGRPKIHVTADQAIAARKAARAKSKAKSKNITVDADVLPLLYAAQKKLADELGFEPNLSQTLRAVIKRSS